MKAAIISGYGPPDVLKIEVVPIPAVKKNDVLVRVRAAAINPKDTFIRKGRFRRFTGSRFPILTGFDFAGDVVEVGAAVPDPIVGEAVCGMVNGWRGGTCAEYIAVTADQFTTKPDSLSYEAAAALPLVSLTALQALRNRAGIAAGHHVCINGASGGVGTMAVQIAKTMGARVTAISSAPNHDFLKTLGADTCIDYRRQDITAKDMAFDIFFDVFGNRPFKSVKRTLTDRGVWVSTVIQPHVFMSVALTRLFSRRKAELVMVNVRRDDLKQVCNWVTSGDIRPVVHSVFSLEKICDAHRQQESKHTRGKIVIRI